MKKLLALTILLCAFPFVASGVEGDGLTLTIVIDRVEPGLDGSSTTTTISISGETIYYYERSYGRNHQVDQRKEFKLDSADIKRISELILAGNLLVKESIIRPEEENGNSYSFRLSFDVELKGKNGLIYIAGPRNAADVKDAKSYKNSVIVVEAVYEIIRRTDKDIIYEPLIR